MRITLRPGDTIPANATILHNVMNAGIQNSIVVEVPDPTPPAPKMIVFVADGEPRKYTTNTAPWRLDMSGELGYLGAYDDRNNCRAHAVQHYRQVAFPLTVESVERLTEIWKYDSSEMGQQLRETLKLINEVK